jgi:hypothetical protein
MTSGGRLGDDAQVGGRHRWSPSLGHDQDLRQPSPTVHFGSPRLTSTVKDQWAQHGRD